MKTLGNMILIVAIGMFLSSTAEAQRPELPEPPAPDQASTPPRDVPNPPSPGSGPRWGPGPRSGPGSGWMMGPGGRGRGAGFGQRQSGWMAGRPRALGGARRAAPMQAERGGRPGRGAAMGHGGRGGRGFGMHRMVSPTRGLRSGRGQQSGPGAQFGRGGGLGTGPGAGLCDGPRRVKDMRQFAGQGRGSRFAPGRKAGPGHKGLQFGTRGGRSQGRGLNSIRQQRRDGSCFGDASGQTQERVKHRIERLRARLQQLETDQP
jgi:hypothetical protein